MSRRFQFLAVAWLILTPILALLLQVFVEAPFWAAASITGLATAVVVFLVRDAGPGHVAEHEPEADSDADID